MKLLITGGSGFVGTTFRNTVACTNLLRNGSEVDLTDLEAVKAAVDAAAPDRVLHLAAQSSVPLSFQDPIGTMKVNFFGTLNLLLALRSLGFKGRFLFVGSGEIYGNVPSERLPIAEVQPIRPRNPYAVSKAAAEALCFQWSQTEAFDVLMTRSFNHIGPGQSECFVVANFAKQVAEIKCGRREHVIRVGDIDVSRDFLDVRDVVQAYLALLEHGENGEAYNVCSGVELSIHWILERLIQLADVKAAIVPDPDRFRPAEQRRVVGDATKLRQRTTWSPQIDIEESLQTILHYSEQELR